MTPRRRILATLRITTLCGVFWGLAGFLGRFGYELLHNGLPLPTATWLALARTFLGYGLAGAVGGALFAAGLLIVAARRRSPDLSPRLAALAGTAAGLGVFLALQVSGLLTPAAGSTLPPTWVALVTTTLLGTGMGVALRGTAARSLGPDHPASRLAP